MIGRKKDNKLNLWEGSMGKIEKIAKVCELCDAAGACYNCNFMEICGIIQGFEELPENALDAMIANGNKPRTAIDRELIREISAAKKHTIPKKTNHVWVTCTEEA